MQKNDCISVVIPAYNEERYLGDVLKAFRELNYRYEIIVVDDGSIDETVDVARKGGALVISHPVNMGQWTALRTGFTTALMNGSNIIVTLDSDGQHDPHHIEKLIAPILRDEVDLVIGSRFMDKSVFEMPLYRALGLTFFNWIMEIILKKPLTDCTSGFRAIRADTLRRITNVLRENQYGSLEFLLKISKLGIRMKEIPVPIKHNATSKKGKLKYGYNLLKTVFSYF